MGHFGSNRIDINYNYPNMNFGEAIAYGALGSMGGYGCNSIYTMPGVSSCYGYAPTNQQVAANAGFQFFNILTNCVFSYISQKSEDKEEKATAKANIKALATEKTELDAQKTALTTKFNDGDKVPDGLSAILPTECEAYTTALAAYNNRNTKYTPDGSFYLDSAAETAKSTWENLKTNKATDTTITDKDISTALTKYTDARTKSTNEYKALESEKTVAYNKLQQKIETELAKVEKALTKNEKDTAEAEGIATPSSTSSSSSSKELKEAEKQAEKAEKKQAKAEAKEQKAKEKQEQKELEASRKDARGRFSNLVYLYEGTGNNNINEIRTFINDLDKTDPELATVFKKELKAKGITLQMGV